MVCSNCRSEKCLQYSMWVCLNKACEKYAYNFKVGKWVLIIEGTFCEYTGIIEEINSNEFNTYRVNVPFKNICWITDNQMICLDCRTEHRVKILLHEIQATEKKLSMLKEQTKIEYL